MSDASQMNLDPKDFWKVAGTYPADKENHYPTHAKAHGMDDHHGVRVYEYGCGGGSDTLSWLRRGNFVTFSDIVPENVAMTEKRVIEGGFAARATARLCLSTLDLPDGPFDVISSHGVVHHIKYAWIRIELLKKFRKILAPPASPGNSGGLFYVMLYTEFLWNALAPHIAGLVKTHGISENQAFGWLTDGTGCPHAQKYTYEEGKGFVEAAGFKLLGVVEYNDRHFRTYKCAVAP